MLQRYSVLGRATKQADLTLIYACDMKHGQ